MSLIDDFPRSALDTGAPILERHGVRGTYYAALSRLDAGSEMGPMFSSNDLPTLHERGHEIGDHTFGHERASTRSALTSLGLSNASWTAASVISWKWTRISGVSSHERMSCTPSPSA